ncbi:MAG: PHP domain-containing protein [Candidatus Tectomicrobia bacterium]|uniref:PHP domain-containing protein n=1 Tax=Tectimicrobiota bacterium TaxID=2528274 RepID=A0A932G092_UNCTE|nr:PHP domain-containing protein [Candidatus Tectomicrobia bacterium]
MIIDMHVHSSASDDAAADVEAYLKWIRFLRKNHQIDGLVLTEHRQYGEETDYAGLAEQYEILILQGAEAETDWGHVLLYGAGEELARRFDLRSPHLKAVELIQEAHRCGGIAVPAHPGRRNIGLCDYEEQLDGISEIRVVEALNGSSKSAENLRAQELAARRGYFGIGGSDAHYVSSIGSCLTRFDFPVRGMDDLVAALRQGRCRPIRLEEAKRQA